MNRIWLVLLGAVAFMMFAVMVLVLIPQVLLARVEAPPELAPYTPTQLEGRKVYMAEGCVYCHTQQIRDPAITTDPDRGWGRETYPADYVHDSPHLLGTMRTGPDLVHVAARLPDRNWHLIHLYQPRAVVPWSIMPSYPYLFELKDAPGPGDVAVNVPPPHAPEGKVVVARAEAIALVDYLLSLDRSYPAPRPVTPSESTGAP